MRGFVGFEGVDAGPDHAVPFRELLGIEVDERSGGRAKLLFRVKAEHLDDGGIVHGGKRCTVLES
ncbi:MAG: hypothetical protein M3273_05525 [Actinomycetota bacterium]|nr:hypothetical protein [Actinomycetota bacterium]